MYYKIIFKEIECRVRIYWLGVLLLYFIALLILNFKKRLGSIEDLKQMENTMAYEWLMKLRI